MEVVVVQELWRRFPWSPEGQLSQERDRLCGGTLLARLAVEIDLTRFVRKGKGEAQRDQVEHPDQRASHMEALIAAAFLAGGWEGAQLVVHRLLRQEWPEALPPAGPEGIAQKDPMSALNELVQAIWGDRGTAEWDCVRTGPDHAPSHTATVTLPDDTSFQAGPLRGKKPVAKAAAAAKAVPYLEGLRVAEQTVQAG